MNPLISIIVPAYNIETYLPRCIDSLLKQTYSSIEIIVVDDGSADQTGIIADRYAVKYPGIIHCLHQTNRGVTFARMAGIDVCTGDWIGFVDGDDEVEPDMYERLLNNALKYDADISHCGYQTVVNNGERIHYFYNTGKTVLQNRIQGLKDLLDGSYIEPSLCNKLFKKEIVLSVDRNQIDTSIRMNEDLMINYLLFHEADRSVYEDFCPYRYMTRSTSVTRSDFKAYKVLDPVKVRKKIAETAEPEISDIAWKKYLLSCANACLRLSEEKTYISEQNELRKVLKNQSARWKLLESKERIKVAAAVYIPGIYNTVYKVYTRHFRKKVYE